MCQLFETTLGIVLLLNSLALVVSVVVSSWTPLIFTAGMLATCVLMLIILGIQYLARMKG